LQLQSLAKKHGDIVPIGTSAEVSYDVACGFADNNFMVN